MSLESMPPMPQNISQEIANSASEAVTPVLSILFQTLEPFLIAIGGLLGLYIIYLIVQAIRNYFERKRLKRIDNNIIKLDKKTDEILKILKKKPRKK